MSICSIALGIAIHMPLQQNGNQEQELHWCVILAAQRHRCEYIGCLNFLERHYVF